MPGSLIHCFYLFCIILLPLSLGKGSQEDTYLVCKMKPPRTRGQRTKVHIVWRVRVRLQLRGVKQERNVQSHTETPYETEPRTNHKGHVENIAALLLFNISGSLPALLARSFTSPPINIHLQNIQTALQSCGFICLRVLLWAKVCVLDSLYFH